MFQINADISPFFRTLRTAERKKFTFESFMLQTILFGLGHFHFFFLWKTLLVNVSKDNGSFLCGEAYVNLLAHQLQIFFKEFGCRVFTPKYTNFSCGSEKKQLEYKFYPNSVLYVSFSSVLLSQVYMGSHKIM